MPEPTRAFARIPSPSPARLVVAATAMATCPGLAAAQTQTLVASGDVLPGLGTVQDVFDVVVNDAGDWAVTLRTDTMLSGEQAILSNGAILAKPGDAIPGLPAGLAFRGASGLSIDEQGRVGWSYAPAETAFSIAAATGIDAAASAAKDQVIGAPGITPGVAYSGFYDQVVLDGGGQIVHAILDDPAISGIQDNALFRLDPQPGGGFQATDLVKRGDVLPGNASAVVDFAETRGSLAANASGQVLYAPRFQNGVTAVYLDQTPLAVQGEPSVVFGSSWSSFTRPAMALNDAGDHAFSARVLLAPPNLTDLLIWNGIEVARTGGSIPAIAPWSFTSLGVNQTLPSSLRLTASGRILWYGEWDDPDDTRNSGLFLDHELVVQEGTTFLGGARLDELATLATAPDRAVFDISADGETIALRAVLEDGRVGAFLIRPAGAVETLAPCNPTPATLTVAQPPLPGSSLAFTMDDPQYVGATGFVLLSALAIQPCGVVVPGIGELLVDVTPPNLFWVGAELIPGISTAIVLTPQLPANDALFGVTFYAQGVWIDGLGASPGEPYRLSNGLALSFGQ